MIFWETLWKKLLTESSENILKEMLGESQRNTWKEPWVFALHLQNCSQEFLLESSLVFSRGFAGSFSYVFFLRFLKFLMEFDLYLHSGLHPEIIFWDVSDFLPVLKIFFPEFLKSNFAAITSDYKVLREKKLLKNP